YFGVENFLRIPSRTNISLLWCFILISFIALEKLTFKLQYSKLICFFISLLIGVESFAWTKKKFNSEQLLHYSEEVNQYIKSNSSHSQVTLNIPSNLFSLENDKREFLYMLNRYHQKNNTVNGAVGYYPESRLQLWSLLNDENITVSAFCNYLSKQNISTVIVFHEWAMNRLDSNQINIVSQSSCLQKVVSVNKIDVYHFKTTAE